MSKTKERLYKGKYTIKKADNILNEYFIKMKNR